jgi:hypothetical protein
LKVKTNEYLNLPADRFEIELKNKKMNSDTLRKYFHDSNENLIAVLSQGYLTIMMQGNLAKSVMFLTDKRLY